MTEADKPHFTAALTELALALDAQMNPEKLRVYWHALQHLDFLALLKAFDRAAAGCRFFPRPVELRAMCGDAAPDVGLVEAALVDHLREPGGDRKRPAHPFLALVVERLGGINQAAGMATFERMLLLGRILPGCIEAATVRELKMLTESDVSPKTLAKALLQVQDLRAETKD